MHTYYNVIVRPTISINDCVRIIRLYDISPLSRTVLYLVMHGMQFLPFRKTIISI